MMTYLNSLGLTFEKQNFVLSEDIFQNLKKMITGIGKLSDKSNEFIADVTEP